MITPVTAPSVGAGLKASWGADVASAINQLAAGYETRAKPLENQRNRRGGDAGAAAGPFEPIFTDGKLTAVDKGLIPWGRSFYLSTPEVEEEIESGGVALEISHATATNGPSAKIVAYDFLNGSLFNSDITKTFLPLYEISGGKITRDFRCYLALAIWE